MAYADQRGELDRLLAKRAKIHPHPVAANAEEIALAAVEQVELSIMSECAIRGKECRRLEDAARQKRDELAAIVAAKATAKTAADLDQRIEAARKALAMVDAREANKVADPQAAAISRLTGRDEDWTRTALHGLIAVLLELGSGVGLFVVFGGRSSPKDPSAATCTSPIITDEPPSEPVPEGSDAIDLFVARQVQRSDGNRVAAAELFAAYEAFCRRQGLVPENIAVFGRKVKLNKGRVGGRVWYFDIAVTP